MRTTVPCPHCCHTLTFIARPRGLACPFCRAEIEDSEGTILIGEKVRCRKCNGAFTAQAPPPAVRLFASLPEPCPRCQLMLAVRSDLPPGKKVRCYRCGVKFQPRRENAGQAASMASTGGHAEHDRNGHAPYMPANEASLDVPVQSPPSANFPANANYDLTAHEPAPTVGGHEAKSKTQLGKQAPRSSITQLAQATPADTSPDAAPSQTSKLDDEVDIFGTDQNDRGMHPNKPPRHESPERPAALDARDNKERPDARRRPSQPAKEASPDRMPEKNAPPYAPVPSDVRTATPPTTKMPSRKKKPAAPARPLKRPRVAAMAPAPVGALPVPAPLIEQSAAPASPTSPVAATRPGLSPAEEESATVLLDASSEVEEIAKDDEVPVLLDEPTAPALNPAPLFPPTPFRPSAPRPEPKPLPDDDDEPTPARTKFLVGTLAFLAIMAGGYYFLFANKPSRSRVYPTDGIVLFQGKPAVGARVTLFPEEKTAGRFLPTGIVGDDGTFKLTTYVPNDGAPAGRYRVGIVRSRLDGDELAELKKKNPPEVVEQILAEKAQDPLYSKYAKMDMTVEIPAPGKQLRFDLD